MDLIALAFLLVATLTFGSALALSGRRAGAPLLAYLVVCGATAALGMAFVASGVKTSPEAAAGQEMFRATLAAWVAANVIARSGRGWFGREERRQLTARAVLLVASLGVIGSIGLDHLTRSAERWGYRGLALVDASVAVVLHAAIGARAHHDDGVPVAALHGLWLHYVFQAGQCAAWELYPPAVGFVALVSTAAFCWSMAAGTRACFSDSAAQ